LKRGSFYIAAGGLNMPAALAAQNCNIDVIPTIDFGRRQLIWPIETDLTSGTTNTWQRDIKATGVSATPYTYGDWYKVGLSLGELDARYQQISGANSGAVTTWTGSGSPATNGEVNVSTTLAAPAAGKYFAVKVVSQTTPNNAHGVLPFITYINGFVGVISSFGSESVLLRSGPLPAQTRGIAAGTPILAHFINDGSDAGGSCTATLEMTVFG
jgi:hypothetical protein